MIIWLTGLPCSGKTTIAKALAARLNGTSSQMDIGRIAEVLDGDELRGSQFAEHVGYEPEQRAAYLRQVGYMARRLEDVGAAWVICAFVSPSEEVRKGLPVDFLVYVNCPASICEERDVKHMWHRARHGEIRNFTGLDGPYDPPANADIEVRTDQQTVEQSVDAILETLHAKTQVLRH